MKICKRGLDFIQVIDAYGNCRICSWNRNNYIGSLLEDDLKTIYHGNMADKVRKPLIEGTYDDCPIDNCPYLANGTIAGELVDIDEIPEYPADLYLAYEGKCNYHCTCCTSYLNMKEATQKDWSVNYDKIEKSIKPILPYVKKISANGRGELFCSPRILKILSEWKPLASQDELSVVLETNGSLFNERNWEKIKNLGQYHLKVAITVMSFQEDVYQYLSGTRLPIDNIINNLRFVKKLREEEIINDFELATVLQEQNFREMPEFTRRCIEEFGADTVRIRPIMPGGPLDEHISWFMDVRNPYHPYYTEYKRIMEHPVFRHPKVLLWSGDCDSTRGEYPGIREKKMAIKDGRILDIIQRIVEDKMFTCKLADFLISQNADRLGIYGIGKIAQIILRLNMLEKKFKTGPLMDNCTRKPAFDEYRIEKPEKVVFENSANMIVLSTVLDSKDSVEKELCGYGFKGRVISIEELTKQIL